MDVGQVGQFQNGVWHVNVRAIWASTHQDRPEGRDSRRGEGPPRTLIKCLNTGSQKVRKYREMPSESVKHFRCVA